MRIILFILILGILPLTALASPINKDGTAEEIRNSIIDSLAKSDLNCIDRVDGSSFMTSMLNLPTIFNENYNLNVSIDTQPIFIIEKFDLGKYSKKKWIMHATTDSDFNIVTELEMKSYHYVTKSKVNIGTTLSPEYIEEVILGNPSEDILCK